MQVSFREVDPFNCWIWLRFADSPDQGERKYLDGIFESWFVIGRLGGFNAENLQAHEGGSDLSWMEYDNNEGNSVMPALMHNMGEFEYQAEWARCWIDMGTSDQFAIDVLVNTLMQVDSDLVQLHEIIIGGVNDDWPVEDHPDRVFPSES